MEPRLLSERTWAEYLGIARATISDYRQHPQFDDLIARVHLELCRMLHRSDALEAGRLHRLIPKVARDAACGFLRSPENSFRTRARDGSPLPAVLSFEADRECLDRPDSLSAWVPDFAPQLIHRLWCRQVWDQFQELLSTEDSHLIRDYFVDNRTQREVAAEKGECERWFENRLQRLLNRYRKREGVPQQNARCRGTQAPDAALERLKLDPEDEGLRTAHHWRIDKHGHLFYTRPEGRGRVMGYYAVLGQPEERIGVLYRDGDPYNLTRANLEVVTRHAKHRETTLANYYANVSDRRAASRKRSARAREERGEVVRQRQRDYYRRNRELIRARQNAGNKRKREKDAVESAQISA